MTFKDEIKAAGSKAAATSADAATSSDSDDIARLLRALNDDLKADPRAIPTDAPDEEDEDEAAPSRHFPLGRFALALLAAGGIGAGVVMYGGASSDTPAPSQTAAIAPVAPGGASPASPPPLTLNPKPATPAQPEALIARAPAPGPAPTPAAPPAAAPVPPIPAPPGRVEPAPVPPPVLPAAPSGTQTVVKPIEPPAIPKIDAPKPAEAKAATVKTVEIKPAEIRLAEPKAPEILKAPEPKAPEPKLAAAVPAPAPAAPPSPAAPAEVKAPEPKAPEPNTTELQAMLSPPKGAQAPASAAKAKAPPAAAPAPAPVTTAAPRPAASTGGRWFVQAGSFSVAENAEAVQRKLSAQGYAAQVIDWTDGSQRSWKIVRVGGYDSQTDARRVADELKAGLKLSPMVVSGR